METAIIVAAIGLLGTVAAVVIKGYFDKKQEERMRQQQALMKQIEWDREDRMRLEEEIKEQEERHQELEKQSRELEEQHRERYKEKVEMEMGAILLIKQLHGLDPRKD
jgi:membrane protein involved in colicin uptake